VGESGMMRTQMGKHIRQEWLQCMGRLVRYHPVNAVTVPSYTYVIIVIVTIMQTDPKIYKKKPP
jgi:hypothetical protein